jgi:hypothetical protein
MKHRLQEVIEFGEKLLKTEDLDPVYVALYKARLPKDQLYRLLLAYFCFYHLGVSARLSEEEGETFWDVMEIAARNKLCDPYEIDSDLPLGSKWPRGAERRHFRGEKCVGAVVYFRRLGAPELVVKQLSTSKRALSLREVINQVESFPMFGPWIAFKVADMLERVVGVPIEFPNDITLLYKEPRAALDMLTISSDAANELLLMHFATIKAPPSYNRFCNIQEVETILCKWKSSVGGHYYVGKDTHEIRQGLKGWGTTADKLSKYLPRNVEPVVGLFA